MHRIVACKTLIALAAMVVIGTWQKRQFIPPDESKPNFPKGPILLGRHDADGKPLPPSLAGYSLLVLPPCQACSIKRLDASDLVRGGLSKVIVLLQSKKSEVPPALARVINRAPYVFEEPWPEQTPRLLMRYAPAFYRLNHRGEVFDLDAL